MSEAEAAKPPVASPGSTPDGRLDLAVPVLLALPWLILLLEPNWVYSKLIYDAWIYFGYFVDLTGHLRALNGFYYSSRLSLLLPGSLAYRLLPPLAANLVLHLAVYYACVFCLYGTLRLSVGRRGAFLAAVALGTNVYVLEAAGRDYVDGFGIAYYLATVLLLTTAGRSRRPGVFWLAAGVTTAALVVTNLFYAVFLPALLSRYVVTSRRVRPAERVRGLFLVWAGGDLLLLAFAAVNLALVGKFWFLESSLRFIAVRFTGQTNPVVSSSAAWFLKAANLATPLTVLVARLSAPRRADAGWVADPPECDAFGREFLGVMAVYAAMYLTGGGRPLETYFYTNLLLPFAYLALAPMLARLSGPLSRREYVALAAAAVSALVAPYAVPATASELDRLGLPQMVAAYAPILVAALLLRTSHPRLTTGVLFFALVGVSNYLTQPVPEDEIDLPLRLNPVLAARHRAYDRDRRSVFLAVHASLREDLAADSKGAALFWFHQHERHGYLFNNIACTYARQRMAGEWFPDVTGPVRPGLKYIILSSEPGALERARRSLLRHGVGVRHLSSRHVREGAIDFSVTVVETVRAREGD